MAESGLPVWDELPVGVRVLREQRSLGALVECSHDESHHHPTGPWVAWRGGPDETVEFDRRFTQRAVRERMPVGFTLDYGGYLRCCVCGGDEVTTESFQKPVKMLVKLSSKVREPQQAGLF